MCIIRSGHQRRPDPSVGRTETVALMTSPWLISSRQEMNFHKRHRKLTGTCDWYTNKWFFIKTALYMFFIDLYAKKVWECPRMLILLKSIKHFTFCRSHPRHTPLFEFHHFCLHTDSSRVHYHGFMHILRFPIRNEWWKLQISIWRNKIKVFMLAQSVFSFLRERVNANNGIAFDRLIPSKSNLTG